MGTEENRKKKKPVPWVNIIADQFGGLLGDTTKKIKKRRKQTR